MSSEYGGSQTGSNTGSLISSNGSGTGLHGFSNGSLNGSGVNVSAASVTNTTSSVGESEKIPTKSLKLDQRFR